MPVPVPVTVVVNGGKLLLLIGDDGWECTLAG
jgi:hypothetical protein